MSIWLYMDVFDCMKMYFQLLRMYLVVYGCIWLYMGLFVFDCIKMYFQRLWMYLVVYGWAWRNLTPVVTRV